MTHGTWTPRELNRMVTTRRQLLETIEMRSATVASMKLLRENISRETNYEIGYNTLRRFFGLLPAREPSARTWSILDSYLKIKREGGGTENFMDEWAHVHELNRLLVGKDVSALIEFLGRHKGTERYSLLLGRATNHFICTEQLQPLVEVYSATSLFEYVESFSEYLGDLVGTTLRELPLNRRLALSPLFSLQHFRESVLYFYIDYAELNGYYGNLLASFNPDSMQERTFLHCLLGYRSYLNGGDLPAIEPLGMDVLESFHPVLAGRYVGYNLLGTQIKPTVAKRMLTRLAVSQDANLMMLEIIPALILKKDFDTMSWVYSQLYEELYELDHWFAYPSMNLFLIAETLMYLHEGNQKRARVVFDSIQLNLTSSSYSAYTNLFYGIAAFQLAWHEGRDDAYLNAWRERQESLVAQTGFDRLTPEFAASYF